MPFQKGHKLSKGRPPGVKNKLTSIKTEFLKGISAEVFKILLEAVREEKAWAIKLIYESFPAIRNEGISFSIPSLEAMEDIIAAHKSIINAMCTGELSPNEASDMMNVVDKHVGAINVLEAHKANELARQFKKEETH